MKQYTTIEQAEHVLENEVVLEYPNLEKNEEIYPSFTPPLLRPDGEVNEPTQLLREVMDLVGDEPKRILELGGGISANPAYLAAHGHDVTVVDSHPFAVDWQNRLAMDLGLARNMRAVLGDVMNLEGQSSYDIIIAEMLLHFLDEADSKKLVAAMRTATVIHGLNILSVYSHDNSPQEQLPPRDVDHFFEDDSLLSLYPEDEWEVIRSEAGPGDRHVDRSFVGKGKVLIPSVVELVVQKTAEPQPAINSVGLASSTATSSYVI